MSGFFSQHRALLAADSIHDFAVERGLDLPAGGTPLQAAPALAQRLGLRSLGFKREDLNPSGSHKDRGLLFQVAAHAAAGARTFGLSSSGNAAVAASRACDALGVRLVAFVHPGTAPHKLARLVQSEAVVVETLRPSNFLRYAHRVFGIPDLRGTRDPLAPVGYRTLGAELAAEAPGASHVLAFNSSGISMEGLLQGADTVGWAARPWSIQAGECFALVKALHPSATAEPDHPAGRLGVKNPPHAAALAADLAHRGGGAELAPLEGTRRWLARLPEHGLPANPELAASLAALESLAAGPLLGGEVVVVVTGGADSSEAAPVPEVPRTYALSSYLELRDLLLSIGLEPLPGQLAGDLQ